MESTVLSIGRSVLSGAVGYASSAVAEEVALQLGIQADHTFIRDELEMMQTFLITAHDKTDDNMVVNTWVKQVRDMSYDVEDGLREFAVRLDKLSWWRIPFTLFDRRRVAKQMKELRAKVEDVSQRNIRYHLIKNPDSKPATISGPSATGSATMPGMEEVRRQWDEAKRDFIRLINRKDDHLRVIGVWGESGDLGETSIIRSTYEALKTHKKFECCAWIKLMHPFDPTEFLKNIMRQFYLNYLQKAGENEKATLEAQDLRRMGMMKKRMGIMKKNDLFYEFKRYLTEKSYLIVLDDLHTIEEWGRIKTCFPNNGKGSRIIVCADQVEIASLCVGPDDIAPEHKQLGADQILHVFYEKGSQDVPNLEEAWPSSHATTNSSANRNNITHLDKSIIESTLEESLLIGRGNEKTEIIKLISRKDGQQLEVISLWGMGGIGKTALIRDIYQSQEMSNKFEKRACVTIKRPFSCDDLLRSLSTQFGYETPNPKKKKFTELESTEKIATYLDSQLEGKKYLIVLDDLWSTKEWDSIIQYLPKRETAGNCIIVTTREENIAKHCSKEERNIKS